MDVSSHNFEHAVQLLQEELDTCAFASIDLEFTGLGAERPSPLDTPASRYQMMRDCATAFPPLQFGLSLFREIPVSEDDEHNNAPRWEMLPFNFSLCPRAVYRDRGSKYPIRDRMMQVQASTIEFLCKNGFDFQKSFSVGVSWLRQCDEESARREVMACFKPPNGYVPQMDKHEKSLIDKFIQRVSEWISKETPNVGDRKMVPLAEFDVNRQLILQAARTHFPKLCVTFADGGAKLGLPPSIRIELMESEDQAIEKTVSVLKKMHEQKAERMIREAVGFRRVIDLLRNAKKPLVVHHGFFDTSKLMANFIEELPETLSEFKRQLLQSFPIVWDTRVLLTSCAAKYVWLNNLLVTEKGRHICGIIDELRMHNDDVPSLSLRMLPKNEFERYDGLHAEQFSHEAGFDSLQTGRLLLYLIATLQGRPACANDVRDACNNEKLASLHNRIYLGSCGGYADIALNKTANVGVSLEEENAVEDSRNSWMRRDDVLVMSGVADEQSKKLPGWEIPYPFYRRVLNELFRGTPYCGRESTVLPSADGVCIFIPKRKRSLVVEPAKKKARRDDKFSSDDSTSVKPHRTTGCYDVTAMECAEESGITEDDMTKIRLAAKERGIEIRPYREALHVDRGRRMRFLV